MSRLARLRIFPKIAMAILCLFIGIMIVVTAMAYTRGYSGGTGLDMAKVQKMRYDAASKESGRSGK